MVAIDSNVVSTYNELAYAASLSYSCAMDVTVAQAGVMDAIYTIWASRLDRDICECSIRYTEIYARMNP